MNTAKKQVRDKDTATIEVALRRAAKKARALAEQTHTPIVVYEKGQVIKKYLGKIKSKQA